MLLLGSIFRKMPVLSLRTGTAVGKVVGHLINPHSLKIEALWCQIGGFKEPRLLLIQDIREVNVKSVIIDDQAVIEEPEEIVRLKPVIELEYDLIDKKVISGRMPIGKISDYAIDSDTFLVHKLYANPNVWSMIKTTKLAFDRSQIVEVSHKYVKVKEAKVKQTESKRQSSGAQPAVAASVSASASVTEE